MPLSYDELVATLMEKLADAEEERRAFEQDAHARLAKMDSVLANLRSQLVLVQRAHQISQSQVSEPIMLGSPAPPKMDEEAQTSRLSERWRNLLVVMGNSDNGFETECTASGVLRYFDRQGVKGLTQRQVRLQLSRMAQSQYLRRITHGRYTFGPRGVELVEDHNRTVAADSVKS